MYAHTHTHTALRGNTFQFWRKQPLAPFGTSRAFATNVTDSFPSLAAYNEFSPHCWWERRLVQPLWNIVWRFLKKLKKEVPYDLAIPLLGVQSCKTIIQKDACTATLIPALFTIAKIRKQLNIYRQMNRQRRCGMHTTEH